MLAGLAVGSFVAYLFSIKKYRDGSYFAPVGMVFFAGLSADFTFLSFIIMWQLTLSTIFLILAVPSFGGRWYLSGMKNRAAVTIAYLLGVIGLACLLLGAITYPPLP
jgi:hypothetical protein